MYTRVLLAIQATMVLYQAVVGAQVLAIDLHRSTIVLA